MNTICSFSSSQASQPSVFYLSLFSGNFYPSSCTLPWFWVSLLSLLNVAETPTFTPSPPLDYPSPHHSLKRPGGLLLPLSHPHRLLSACIPCLIPPRNSAFSPCPSFPYHSQWHQRSTWRLAKTGHYFHLLLFPLICPVLKLYLCHGAPLQILTGLIAFFLLLQYLQQTIPEYTSKNTGERKVEWTWLDTGWWMLGLGDGYMGVYYSSAYTPSIFYSKMSYKLGSEECYFLCILNLFTMPLYR